MVVRKKHKINHLLKKKFVKLSTPLILCSLLMIFTFNTEIYQNGGNSKQVTAVSLAEDESGLEKLTCIDDFPTTTSCKASELIPHESIEINGNEDFASQAFAEDWPGNGSQFNPYVISGLNITSGSYQWWYDSLVISNVSCNFLVQNSLISMMGFTNVTNGQIVNNTIHYLQMTKCSWNNFTNNIVYEIVLDYSSDNNVINNTFTRFFLQNSPDNIISENQLSTGFYIVSDDPESCIQTEVINNSVNGKPILFWYNKVKETVPMGLGQLILINCSRLTISDQNLTARLFCFFSDSIDIFNSTMHLGVFLEYSTNCNTSNSKMNGSVHLKNSSNNNYRNNVIERSSSILSSSNNSFINNTYNYRDNGVDFLPAIFVESSQYNIFANNTFTRAEMGFSLTTSSNNIISHNSLLNGGSISLSFSQNNTISHNILFDYFDFYSYAVIDLRDSSTNNSILNNNCDSIRFEDSPNNTIKNNLLRGELLISRNSIESYIQTEVVNNSVNCKPIIYWYNNVNETVPGGAGQIILINCAMISIYNQVDCGIVISFCQKITVIDNYSNSTNGRIFLEYSSDCIISDNIIQHSENNGIEIRDSINCTINNNTIAMSGDDGISLFESSNCIISNNTIIEIKYVHYSNKGPGIILSRSSYNEITNNEIKNCGHGIHLDWSSSNNIISDNVISNNYEIGINIGSWYDPHCDYNIIKGNLILESGDYGLHIYKSFNNDISLNSFINNNLYFPDRESQALEDFTLDNHFINNYWSDWSSPDDNHDNIVDFPYTIGSNPEDSQTNQDSYPLAISPHSQFRIIFPPQIIVPTGQEIFQESITISWLPAYDTYGHSVKYSVYYSVDSGTNWIMLVKNLEGTEFIWDVSILASGSFYIIKVLATFKDGVTASDISEEPFTILNPFTTTSTTTSANPSSFPALTMLLAGLILGMGRNKTREKLKKNRYVNFNEKY